MLHLRVLMRTLFNIIAWNRYEPAGRTPKRQKAERNSSGWQEAIAKSIQSLADARLASTASLHAASAPPAIVAPNTTSADVVLQLSEQYLKLKARQKQLEDIGGDDARLFSDSIQDEIEKLKAQIEEMKKK